MTKQKRPGQGHYKKKTVALIATVFNEEKNILLLLESYARQKVLADEFVIVDANSTDRTWQILQHYALEHPLLNLRLFQHAGNRSQGRNYAVKKTSADWLAITDAGCRLEPNWLAELLAKQAEKNARVVAGYYSGFAANILQEAMIPYFLVMPKRLNGNFLPATRSMLISRSLWLEMRGLAEDLQVSEDYHFAQRLLEKNEPIAVAKKAIVYWQAPENLRQFTEKISAMAASDFQANLVRPKVKLIFARYLFMFFLLFLICLFNSIFLYSLFVFFIILYLAWSLAKNYEYCPNSWFFGPLLQILSDVTILYATSMMALQLYLKRKKS